MKRLILLLTLTATLSAFSKKTVEVMTTRADSQVLLETQQLKIGSALGTANSIITLDAKQKYQTMDGFGFALTYSACYNLMKMTPQDRHNLLVKTFSPVDGFGVNYVRMSIAPAPTSRANATLIANRKDRMTTCWLTLSCTMMNSLM